MHSAALPLLATVIMIFDIATNRYYQHFRNIWMFLGQGLFIFQGTRKSDFVGEFELLGPYYM